MEGISWWDHWTRWVVLWEAFPSALVGLVRVDAVCVLLFPTYLREAGGLLPRGRVNETLRLSLVRKTSLDDLSHGVHRF